MLKFSDKLPLELVSMIFAGKRFHCTEEMSIIACMLVNSRALFSKTSSDLRDFQWSVGCR